MKKPLQRVAAYRPTVVTLELSLVYNINVFMCILNKEVFMNDKKSSGIDPAEISRIMTHAVALAQELNYRLECADMIDEARLVKEQIRCCMQTLAMVQNDLEMSQYETGRVQAVRFNISEAVDDLVSMVRSKMRRSKMKIECEVENGLIALADPDRFLTCLMNLIVNSLQKVDQEEGAVLVTVKRRFDVAAVSVIDNGYGMTQQQLGEIVNSGNGSRGLDILKKFSESVDTSPLYETIENGGFRVTVKVPLAPPEDDLEFKSDIVQPKMGTFSPCLVLLYKLDDAAISL